MTGIRYLSGNYTVVSTPAPSISPSGTTVNTVTDTTLRLYQVKGSNPTGVNFFFYNLSGKKNIIVKQVEPNCKSLNKGDVFLLVDHASSKIYQWNGGQASRYEEWLLLNFII
jgi:hypothetical protein